MDIHRDRNWNNSYVYSHVCGKSSNKYAVGKDISILIIINTTVKLIKKGKQAEKVIAKGYLINLFHRKWLCTWRMCLKIYNIFMSYPTLLCFWSLTDLWMKLKGVLLIKMNKWLNKKYWDWFEYCLCYVSRKKEIYGVSKF